MKNFFILFLLVFIFGIVPATLTVIATKAIFHINMIAMWDFNPACTILCAVGISLLATLVGITCIYVAVSIILHYRNN